MPNIFKSPEFATSPALNKTESRRKVKEGGVTISTWIVGGVVLAACSHGKNTTALFTLEEDSDQAALRGAFDGPVKGAKIYIDKDRTGSIDPDAEYFVTDEDGLVEVPGQYTKFPVIADFNGAVDVQSGAVLGGEAVAGGVAPDLTFRSLEPVDPDAMLLATPLTDLLARSEDPQALLDAIFGIGIVTLADVNDPDFYSLPAPPASAEELAIYQDSVEYKFAQICISLIELRNNPSIRSSLEDNPVKTAAVLREIISGDGEVLTGNVEDASVKSAVDAISGTLQDRLDDAVEIASGKPVAAPNHDQLDLETMSGEEFRFIDHFIVDGTVSHEQIDTFFGFIDPGGNVEGIRSYLHGILLKVKLDENGMTVITIEGENSAEVIVAMIGLVDADKPDAALTPLVLGGPAGLDDSIEAEIGQEYAYVNFNSLPNLVIKPVAGHTGEINVIFRVWDGENISEDATFTIRVTPSDETPPVTTPPTTTPDPTGEITLSETIVEPGDSLVGVITITNAAGEPVDPELIRIEGNDANLFEIQIDESTGIPELHFIGQRPDEGVEYEIILTAPDPDHPGQNISVTETIRLTGSLYILDQDGITKYSSGQREIEENFSSEFIIGEIRHEMGPASFLLAPNASGAGNDMFSIIEEDGIFKLLFTGSHSGDFESGDNIRLVITATSLDDQEIEVTEEYIIPLINVDEHGPVFTSPAVVQVQENAASGTMLAEVTAEDADGDTVSFSLDPTERRFAIDSQSGVLTLLDPDALDFEAGNIEITVTASSTSLLAGGQHLRLTQQTLRLELGDANEAATEIRITENVLMQGNPEIGRLVANDPDAGPHNHVFSLITDNEAGGADDAAAADTPLFEIRGDALYFIGAGEVAGEGDRKAELENYQVRVQVADAQDSTVPAYTQILTIYETSTFFLEDISNRRLSSGFEEDGQGILAEHADGTTNPIELGELKDVSGMVASFALMPADGENSNNLFEITQGNMLVFNGGDAGDFEGQDNLTLDLADASQPEKKLLSYVIHLANMDEAPTGISLSKTILLPTGGVVGTVTVTDPDAGENYTADNISVSDQTNFEVQANVGTGAIELRYIGATPVPQQTYAITLIVADPDDNTLKYQKDFTINVGSIYIERSDASKAFSGDSIGLLTENIDGSTDKVEIGALRHEGGNTIFTLVSGAGNDNDLFEINSGKLYYRGPNSGDFEANEILTVSINSVDASDVNAITENYVIHLMDADDNSPRFTDEHGAEINRHSISISEDSDVGISLYQARAVDADAPDVITYSIHSVTRTSGEEMPLDWFSIAPETGELTLASEAALDYSEVGDLSIIIEASSTSLLGGSDPVIKTQSLALTIQVEEMDMRPISISLSRNAAVQEDRVIGLVHVEDPNISENFRAQDFIIGGQDSAQFEMVDEDGDVQIRFRDEAAIRPESGGRKPLGQVYHITLNVTDMGGLSLPEPEVVEIIEGSLFILDAEDGISARYTKYQDENGHGLLAENTNGAAEGVVIGALGDHLEAISYHLEAGVEGNDDFDIVNGSLVYTGADSGDFEKAETIVVSISMTTSQGVVISENYLIYLSDGNDAPIIDSAAGASMGIGQLTEDDGNPDIGDNRLVLRENMFMLSDVDIADQAEDGTLGSGFSFTVSGSTNGHVEVGREDRTTFTIDELRTGQVEFVRDGSELFEIENGVLTNIPRPTTLTLILNDGELESDPKTVTFNVLPYDDAPDIVPTTEDFPITHTIHGLTFEVISKDFVGIAFQAHSSLTEFSVFDPSLNDPTFPKGFLGYFYIPSDGNMTWNEIVEKLNGLIETDQLTATSIENPRVTEGYDPAGLIGNVLDTETVLPTSYPLDGAYIDAQFISIHGMVLYAKDGRSISGWTIEFKPANGAETGFVEEIDADRGVLVIRTRDGENLDAPARIAELVDDIAAGPEGINLPNGIGMDLAASNHETFTTLFGLTLDSNFTPSAYRQGDYLNTGADNADNEKHGKENGVFAAYNGQKVAEGDMQVLSHEALMMFNDMPDTDATSLIYTLNRLPAHGLLELQGCLAPIFCATNFRLLY
ncbi:cadherin repeat domain-containing protein [Alphaproteobacteria bacterium LSUCC0684]